MKIKAFVLSFTLGSSLIFAQLAPGGPGPGGRGPRGMHAGKVVTGAPYSATFTNTSLKTLADGNTIQRTTTGTVARDSQGRTYSQETITGLFGQTGTKTVTFISDPVAGYVYTLNSDTKTAIRRPFHAAGGPSGETANFRNEARPANPNVVSAELGTQTVNGVNATGKTITHTIPAGQMGNEKPIVSTTETWTSPDLQVVISSKRTDPREGTSTYALTNIQRAEPSNISFAVPSDYTVKDAQSFHGRQ